MKTKPDFEYLCRAFYDTTLQIRTLTQELRGDACPEEDEDTKSGSHLSMFFADDATIEEVQACSICSRKYDVIHQRRTLKRQLGGLKRKIFNAGKSTYAF